MHANQTNAPMPPRPSSEAVRQARALISRPGDFTHLPPADWLDLTRTAWYILRTERSHSTARTAVLIVNGGDAA